MANTFYRADGGEWVNLIFVRRLFIREFFDESDETGFEVVAELEPGDDYTILSSGFTSQEQADSYIENVIKGLSYD